jgi:hypothetical protein
MGARQSAVTRKEDLLRRTTLAGICGTRDGGCARTRKLGRLGGGGRLLSLGERRFVLGHRSLLQAVPRVSALLRLRSDVERVARFLNAVAAPVQSPISHWLIRARGTRPPIGRCR